MRKRRKKARATTRQDMGGGGDFTIYKDGGSTEKEDNNKSNETKVEIADSVGTGSSGFFVFSPNNDCAGAIDSMIGGGGVINPQSLFGNGNNDNDNNYAQLKACIGRDGLSLILQVFSLFIKRRWGHHCVCFKSVVGTSLEKEANWILKILVRIQGADLRRFNKHKKRATLWMGEYPPVMSCTFLWYKRH
jgi:hypothetical protein